MEKIARWSPPTDMNCEFLIDENAQLIEVIRKPEQLSHLSDQECFDVVMAETMQIQEENALIDQAQSLVQEILDEEV